MSLFENAINWDVVDNLTDEQATAILAMFEKKGK